MRKSLADATDKLNSGSRRSRLLVALGAIGAAALAIGLTVGAGLPDSSQGASTPKKVSGAATVQRRDLVATDTESGTLNYANPQTVYNRLSGTITWLPQVGQIVQAGQALYRVDGSPSVLFNGDTPAYRDLTSGDTDGSDILELNEDLKSMGFDPDNAITVNDSWQDATTNAVEAWQNSLGMTETGTITLGQVVFLPGEQRITSINTTLGSTGAASSGSGASDGSSSSGSTTDGVFVPHTEFVSLTTKPTASAASVSAASTAAAAARAAQAKAEWNLACAAHDLVRLAALQRQYPTVLGSLPIALCEAKPAAPSRPAPKPTAPKPTVPELTPKPATDPAPTTRTLVLPTWGADATEASSDAVRPGRNGGTTGLSIGNGPVTNQTIGRALEALLKATTALLKRSSGTGSGTGTSTGRGSTGEESTGASGSSRSGVSSGGESRSGGSSSSSSGTGGSELSSGSGSSASAGGGGGSSDSGASDSGGATATAILGTTSNQLNVVVDLDATKQSEAVVGEPVSVEMPDGSTVKGKITQVSPIAQSTSSSSSGSSSSSSSSSGSGSSGSTASATIPVTIAVEGKLPASGLDQAAVSVNFEQQVENNVLSVPVTALLATAGGGYAVQEAGAPHQLIPVTPGLFAAGYVQVSSSQIYPGLQVTDSQG